MATSDHCHHQIPGDILVEILVRIPVKSLLRFKCICKNWYDLIQSPDFTQTHISFQKLYNKGRIFFQYFSYDTQKHGYALFPDETLASDAYHDIDYVQDQVLAEIEGPVNGLFCLSNCEDRFIIWNPAIREFRTLPYPYHPNLPPHLEVYEYSIGFGLDPLTGGFKLVLIRQVENFKKRTLDAYVTVFTLCTNTWRHLDGLDHLTGDYLFCPSTTGKHVDGVYYWWTGCAILTFDMGMEVFRVIPAPFILPWELYCSYCNVTLYDNDRIALYQFKDVLESGIDKWCDVWVMGVEGSWIKQFTVGPLPGIVVPMGFWKNGELLFLTNSPQNYGYQFEQLVMYNPRTQQNRHLGPKGNGGTFQAVVYHESLVSVKGGMYQRKGKLSDSVATQYLFVRNPRPEFMSKLVEFMNQFQCIKEAGKEPTPENLGQEKVHRLLPRVWDAC